MSETLIDRVRPAAGEPEGALVLLHGRGTGEHDLAPLLDVLDPDCRLHAATPRGPLELPPGGAHWYAVRRIGFPDPDTFLAACDQLGAWLDALLGEAGVPLQRTIIGGFSQGAVMSYALALGRGGPGPRACSRSAASCPRWRASSSSSPTWRAFRRRSPTVRAIR